ncbi:MAG: hypothetical protein F3743_01200 [Nitrospinae bacterium]|nr:hypothetical protein [Nitrospinota bacterium]MZH04003.1 hypothetical protein [Nitrospinota bacterium]MZH13809.1 hypothetical protein [Nitrospinota bacterium]
MSTILKTLKKLEEEKSVLEKKLDLKELVLQDEDGFGVDSKIPLKFLWKSVLILVGTVLGVVWLWKDNPPEQPVVQFARAQPGYLQQTPPVKKQTVSSVPGIPLSNIPEQVISKTPQDTSSEIRAPKPVKESSGIERKAAERAKPIVPGMRGNLSHEKGILEIQSLIASAKSLADEPDDIRIPQINSHLSIPGLIVKGIIFFSPDSSSNHIFVSNAQTSNHKMRIGDTIDSATLMKIESTGAVFAYQGESVFMGIGQSGG